jgi:hypothetical protein
MYVKQALDIAIPAQDDYEAWWHSHFGQSMGWPNQPRRRRTKKS